MQTIILTPEDLAVRWNVAPATLSQWRWNGRGPRFFKMNKGVRYRLQDVEKFEEQNMRQSTSSHYMEERL